MTTTVLSMLTQSLYLSSITSKDFNTPTSNQVDDALMCLNDILSEKSVDGALNPYYTSQTFNCVTGQEAYFIDNLIQVDTLTFILNEVRFPMQYVPRDTYDGTARAINVTSLPYMYYVERSEGGATIYMYYPPNQTYTFTIWGKFALNDNVGLFTDLETVYDKFYISYLKVAVADRLCLYYNIDTPRNIMMQMEKFDTVFSNQIAPPDLTVSGISLFSTFVWPNWAIINIGNQGWFP